MILKGIDVPIAILRNSFASRLWTDVDKKIYYSRVFRNMSKQNDLIGEVFIANNEYEEVHFNDKYYVNSFFDVSDVISEAEYGLQTRRDVGIIFAVRVDKIYPDLIYRAVEELYADVLAVINNISGARIIVNDIVAGLNAYGDLSTVRLKSYNMHPWHVFRVNTTMDVDYGCGLKYNSTAAIYAFEYPYPIVFTN